MRMALIELQDVSKLYGFGDAATVALDEVSLHIEEGEFVAVMGPSGCGKSTLLYLIGGFLPTELGAIRVDGAPIARLTPSGAADLAARLTP